MTNYISQIDTRRFGFTIAKINDPGILQKKNFIQTLKEHNIEMVITRIESEKINEINLLEDIGFRLKDEQSTWISPSPDRLSVYRQSLESRQSPASLIGIREGSPADIPAIRDMAANAFDNYGHYFADARLDKDRCREIYPDWAARTLTDKTAADKILVAVEHDRPVGFLALKIAGTGDSEYAAVALGAVAAAFRGKNIYASLIIEGINWGQTRNLAWQEHNILVANYPVSRVLSKLGFRPARAFVTLHYWLGTN